MQCALLLYVISTWFMALIWVPGDERLREALPSCHPLPSTVVQAVVVFPFVFKIMFGRVGAQLFLWLPHFSLLVLGHRIPALALRFDPDSWLDSNMESAFLSMSIILMVAAIYFSLWLQGLYQSAGRRSATSEGDHRWNGVAVEPAGRPALSTDGSASSGMLVLDEVVLPSRGRDFDWMEFSSDFNTVPDYRSWQSSGNNSGASTGVATFASVSVATRTAAQSLATAGTVEDPDERDVESI